MTASQLQSELLSKVQKDFLADTSEPAILQYNAHFRKSRKHPLRVI